MIKRSYLFFSMIMVLLIAGCIKETYDMKMLSKLDHLSPTIGISAINGDISFKDMVKKSDTVRFGTDNFVTLVFKLDSLISLKPSDFMPAKGLVNSKGYVGIQEAAIPPHTIDLGIADVLNHLTGDFIISDPSIKFNYINSFADPIQITLNASARRAANSMNLSLAPFTLDHPATSNDPPVTSTFVINKSNSNISEIVSMPPEEIDFSGLIRINSTAANAGDYLSSATGLYSSIEIDLPLELRMDNLQFTDTTDNFLADAFGKNDNIKWEDFELFRIDLNVKNGFPLGASMSMSLVDSTSHLVISTLVANDIFKAAPVGADKIVTGAATSSSSIAFTQEFFNSIDRSDKIIFKFTLNTTDNGTKDVKIYSTYKINFLASVVMKPDIKLNLK